MITLGGVVVGFLAYGLVGAIVGGIVGSIITSQLRKKDGE